MCRQTVQKPCDGDVQEEASAPGFVEENNNNKPPGAEQEGRRRGEEAAVLWCKPRCIPTVSLRDGSCVKSRFVVENKCSRLMSAETWGGGQDEEGVGVAG